MTRVTSSDEAGDDVVAPDMEALGGALSLTTACLLVSIVAGDVVGIVLSLGASWLLAVEFVRQLTNHARDLEDGGEE